MIVAVSTEIAAFFGRIIPTSNFVLALLNGLIGNKYLIMTTLTMILATAFPTQVGEIAGAQEIGTFMIHIFFGVIGAPASIYLILTKAPLLLVFCAIIVATNMLISFLFGNFSSSIWKKSVLHPMQTLEDQQLLLLLRLQRDGTP